uniref:ATP synthase subunit a n=1 Tax=Biomphalaria pfeifferi TaxID=112525 RepID=A0A2U8J9G0_BIOPF|nr:ATP synthase F0 subunit 6 [Biomphalaria pfeifferi]AWK49463.1 ATP synthase F0 subunit 6 [Biomphalaria pfeifferi]
MFFLVKIFTDLFSSLDGCTNMYSWMMTLVLSLIYYNKTFHYSSNSTLVKSLISLGQGNKKIMPMGLLIINIFFMLINMNLLGLTPFTYSMTSSLWYASSLALIMWMLLLISGYFYSFKKSLAHLVPSGAPLVLVPFLIIIESISILIRPLTLTVRLIANISAGHIVLSLIANVLSSLNISSMLLVLVISVGYNMFEVFVCFIQAYIFTLLLKLYSIEHPSFNWSM